MWLLFQVEFSAVTNIRLITSLDSVLASWAPAECADHYIIRVKKSVGSSPPSDDHEHVRHEEHLYMNEGSGMVTPIMQSFSDDEDYHQEESGSGELHPVTEAVHDDHNRGAMAEEHQDTGFQYGYGNNLIIEREQSEDEDYFVTSPSYDYYDGAYDETSKVTTPTSFLADDEDYANEASGSEESHKEQIIGEKTTFDIDNLEYYEDTEEDGGWWKRRKRSAYEDDSSIEALLALDDISNESDEYLSDIERILSLDHERENAKSNNNDFVAKVETNSGEIKGLDPCSSYTLDVRAVYQHDVLIDSEEKEFHTLCQEACDASGLDFEASMDESTKMVTIKLENEPDCIKEYALKYCINQNQTCDSRHNLKSTNSELIILDAFKPCLDYDVSLLPVSDENELMTHEESQWDNATNKLIKFESSNEPPVSTDSSVRSLTHQAATISWLRPNECVDGYRISLYEIQHLPKLNPTFAAGKNELLTLRMNLSNSDLSLELTNLTSCRLHRADIESFYSSVPGDL